MKILSLLWILAACLFCIPASTSFAQTAKEEYTHGCIDGKALKTMLDAEVPLVLLDARGYKWNDPSKIAGAEMASYEFSDEEIAEIIKDRNSLIVVYCFSATCPLRGRLVARLAELGYPNIIQYVNGLKEWRNVFDFPVETMTRDAI